MRRRVFLAIAATWFALAAGCAPRRLPDLGELYNRAAQYHGERRNPVILIPGILGSRLIDSKTGRVIWGAFSGDYADPRDPEGARLCALPMREAVRLEEMRDTAVPGGVLDRLRFPIFGLPGELKAYAEILRTLGAGGYRDEDLGLFGAIDYGEGHFTCFQFPYDWRRDNVENARRLHAFILEKRAYVQAELKRRFGVEGYDVKFDIVAHSMGGLIARYYLRYGTADLPADGSLPPVTWEGSKHVAKAVLIGTPNAGSLEGFKDLVEGLELGFFLPSYEAAIVGTMPSVYQLLPRSRHGALADADSAKPPMDVFDPELWIRMGWGLASRDQDRVLEALLPDAGDPATRRRIALDHLAKCLKRARQFTSALDVPTSPPPGVSLYLVVGDALPTDAVMSVNARTGARAVVEKRPGDGSVLRSSALLDERVGGAWEPTLVSPICWKQVLFLFTDHLGLTKDPAFTDNVLFFLMERPRQD
ncbi:MAG: hypothetical protein HY721_16145 [Planctomycetes bacterium]|nr:hypothetical protein [Planctomycetota bacterium]